MDGIAAEPVVVLTVRDVLLAVGGAVLAIAQGLALLTRVRGMRQPSAVIPNGDRVAHALEENTQAIRAVAVALGESDRQANRERTAMDRDSAKRHQDTLNAIHAVAVALAAQGNRPPG